MAERARQLHEEWRSADARARQAEEAIARAWEDFFASKRAAPTEEETLSVRRLRYAATAQLQQLTEYLARAARDQASR